MEGSRTPGHSDYAVRALVVVLGAAAVHGVFASILLRLLVGPDELPGQALSVALCVLLTALAELAFLYVRTQYASPDHVARTLPWVCWTTPALASVALPLVAVPIPDGPLVDALLVAIGPVFAACASVGLIVGMLVDRLLRILAATYPQGAAEPALLAPSPPTLAYSYVRIIFVSALASTVVALAVVLMRSGPAATGDDVWLWVLALGLLLGWAPLAAATLGMSPGSDIRSLARRLDAYDDDAVEATRRPVVVTRGDEVGAFARQPRGAALQTARRTRELSDGVAPDPGCRLSQGRLSQRGEPRAPHPAQRGGRLRAAAARGLRRRAQRTPSRRRRADPRRRPATAGADQRHPRHVDDRVGRAAAIVRQPPTCPSWCGRW